MFRDNYKTFFKLMNRKKNKCTKLYTLITFQDRKSGGGGVLEKSSLKHCKHPKVKFRFKLFGVFEIILL